MRAIASAQQWIAVQPELIDEVRRDAGAGLGFVRADADVVLAKVRRERRQFWNASASRKSAQTLSAELVLQAAVQAPSGKPDLLLSQRCPAAQAWSFKPVT